MLLLNKIIRCCREFAGCKTLILFLSLASMSLFLIACGGHSEATSEEKDYYEEEYEIPSPDNLERFFDSLQNNTEASVGIMYYDDEQYKSDSLEVLKSIRALDDFQAGRKGVFPLQQVRDVLGDMVYFQWFYATHGSRGEEDEDGIGGRIFFRNYLEQVARLCPHVDYLTSIHTGDDVAGIFTGQEFSFGHQVTDYWLLYRWKGGYHVTYLSNWSIYEQIRVLVDTSGNNYLLCYTGGGDPYMASLFRATLFMKKGEEFEMVCKMDNWPNVEQYALDDKCLDYNPQAMIWTVCDMRGDKKIPAKGFKRLRLVLDGGDSRFVLSD